MLIKRLMTGAILLAVFYFLFFFASAMVFFWAVSLLLALSTWEWGGLIGLNVTKRIGLILLYFALAFLMLRLPVVFLLVLCTAWWCLAFLIILAYAKGKVLWTKKTWVGVLMGIPALGSAYLGFNVLRSFDNGPAIVFYFVLLIATADSFAYFVGRAVGKRKLLVSLSPNKTWEGFFGGLLMSMILAVSASVYFRLPFGALCFFVSISFVAVLFSVIGDLFISLLKRQRHLKDTGSLLPGHGGLLDRLDGMNASVSVFALGIILMVFGLK